MLSVNISCMPNVDGCVLLLYIMFANMQSSQKRVGDLW